MNIPTRAAAWFTMGATLVLLSSTPASADPADLIDTNTVSVSIEAPAPGESQDFDLSVTSVTDQAVPLDLTVVETSGGLLSGPTPLEVTLVDDDGNVVLAPARADSLEETFIDLPHLSSGATYHLTGTVTLPAEAGNEYQGASGVLVFRFLATGEDPEQPALDPASPPSATPSSPLATTGAQITAALVAVLVLVATGGCLLAARRKREHHA